MASKGLQDLKQQVEGAAQEAGENRARRGPARCTRGLRGASQWTVQPESQGVGVEGRQEGLSPELQGPGRTPTPTSSGMMP